MVHRDVDGFRGCERDSHTGGEDDCRDAVTRGGDRDVASVFVVAIVENRPPTSDDTAANRLFDESVAGLGHDDCDDERDEEIPGAVTRIGEEEDRPVPEVQAIGPLADFDQRPRTEHAPDRHSIGMHRRGDENERRHRHESQTTSIEERTLDGERQRE